MKMQIFVVAIILFLTANFAFSQTAKVHFDKAMTKYYVENDLDGAIMELEEAIKIDPGYEDGERFLKILLNQKKIESVGQAAVKAPEPSETSKPEESGQETESPITEVHAEGIKESPPVVETKHETPKGEEVDSIIPVEEITRKSIGEIPKPAQVTAEYIIGIEDVLEISVWQNEELSKEVTVRPDGKISYPLIGDVPAQGLTLTEIDIIITGRLKEYIRNPQVSIMVKKLGGKKVIVLGEVKTPGVYRFTGDIRLLEVVGLAGGFSEDAKLKNVLIIRGDMRKNKAKASSINVADVWKEGKMNNNVLIEPMDIVYVPRSIIGNLNLFLRQITPTLRVVYDSVVIEDVLNR